jgi:hypothetical protein
LSEDSSVYELNVKGENVGTFATGIENPTSLALLEKHNLVAVSGSDGVFFFNTTAGLNNGRLEKSDASSSSLSFPFYASSVTQGEEENEVLVQDFDYSIHRRCIPGKAKACRPNADLQLTSGDFDLLAMSRF